MTEVMNGGGEIQTVESFNLDLSRKPSTVIAEAQIVADALRKAVQKNKWEKSFGGTKPHLYFEAWQFAGMMYRIFPRVRETRFVQYGNVHGFEATAEAVHGPTGQVISAGEAMCLNDEDHWGLRPKYEYPNNVKTKVGDVPVPLFQLRSMAQTRASAKALKNVFSWIVSMAGYDPTVVEEMTGTERHTSTTASSSVSMPQTKKAEAGGAGSVTAAQQQQRELISEPQRKRLWGISKDAGLDNDAVLAIIKKHGFERSEQITKDKYEAICRAVEAAKPSGAADS